MPYERVTLDGTTKAFVLCGEFSPLLRPEGKVALPDVEQWRSLLREMVQRPESLPGYVSLKYSGESEVFRANLNLGNEVVAFVGKRSKASGIARKLQDLLVGSRERRQFELARRVREIGVLTATPLALVERRRPERDGWLLTEYLGEVVDLDRFCLMDLPRMEPRAAHRVKSAIVNGIVELFEKFRGAGLFHRDLKASNILLMGPMGVAAEPRVALVDLEGIRSWGGGSLKRWEGAVVRLGASLIGSHAVTKADFLRFLRRYDEATSRERDSWKARFRKLAQDANRYVQGARARKRERIDR